MNQPLSQLIKHNLLALQFYAKNYVSTPIEAIIEKLSAIKLDILRAFLKYIYTDPNTPRIGHPVCSCCYIKLCFSSTTENIYKRSETLLFL